MDIPSKLTKNNKIALFDSGVGQLSVYLEVKKLMPNENYVIFADQKNMPYGEKSPNEIKRFVSKALKFLIAKHNIKMMILACNTATVLALEDLRKKFSIPIIGVVPAIKPASEISKNKRIVNMSTPATAKSSYLENLIKKFASDCKVLKLGCPGLENAVENLNVNQIDKIVKKYTKKVNKFDPDVVVLGCTHYPIVKKDIKKNLKKGIVIIDSGYAIAKQAKKVLKESNLLSVKRGQDIFYTTADAKKFSKITSNILKRKVYAENIAL